MEVRRLDLASIKAFAVDHGERPLDVLVNNAGVMAVPQRRETVDGFELQMGGNALGPLALTVRLLPALLRTPGARVATMSSGVAHFGRVDLDREHRYSPWRAYAASKLADLLLTRHLARLADDRGWDLRSTAAHPGYTHTNLQLTGPNLGRSTPARRPGGPFELAGPTARARFPRRALDADLAARFWATAQERTGVELPLSTV